MYRLFSVFKTSPNERKLTNCSDPLKSMRSFPLLLYKNERSPEDQRFLSNIFRTVPSILEVGNPKRLSSTPTINFLSRPCRCRSILEGPKLPQAPNCSNLRKFSYFGFLENHEIPLCICILRFFKYSGLPRFDLFASALSFHNSLLAARTNLCAGVSRFANLIVRSLKEMKKLVRNLPKGIENEFLLRNFILTTDFYFERNRRNDNSEEGLKVI